MNKTILTLICLLTSLILSSHKLVFETITLRISVWDKETKERIMDANCVLEVKYETEKCLPPIYSYIRNDRVVKLPVSENLKKPHKFSLPPWRTITQQFVMKSYKITVQAPNYKTVIKNDSTDNCEHATHIEIEMECD